MLKKIINPVVSVWHDFLHWWNAIPQAVMSTKLMHHYEVTRFLMSVITFIAFILVPYSFIRQYWNQFSVIVQENIWNGIILINIAFSLGIAYLMSINGKLETPFRTSTIFEILIVINKWLFFGGMIYAAGNSGGRIHDETSGTCIMLYLFLWFLLYCYSKVIQWLIKLSVNKDIVWSEASVGDTKYFKLDSVWRQYAQMPKPDNTYPIGMTAEEADEFDKKFRRYPESVNTNEFIARKAQLPYQLVQQAKALDQIGAYSLPEVKLETPWPLKYQFKVPVNYFIKLMPVLDGKIGKGTQKHAD